MKMIAVEGFQDHMFQRCEKPSPLLTHLSFLHKKTEQRILHTFWHFFFIKTDLINKGQKGGHPIYCYYPFWGHLELEFFDDFWLKAQKLLMELCMKIKMRKSLYQFHCKQNASSWDKHSTKPWCLREVNIRLFYFWSRILPILKKGLSKWFLGLLYKIILF